MEELKKLGVGIGFREPFRADIFLHQEKIDFLEITADHYFDATGKKLEEIDILRQHFPLIPHGLDLSLGSAEGIDEDYLEKFADLVDLVNPEWFSDHICFTRSGGTSIGHLAPLPFTNEALSVLIRNIETVRKRINTPLVLENITYMVRFPSSEMSETQFLKRVLEETDSGLLLDVTNLYINSRNFDFSWREFLDEIPLERVVQIHFVGSHRHGRKFIDAHSHKTENEIWEVFREVASRCDVKGAILERDGNFPPFGEILDEIEGARKIMNRCDNIQSRKYKMEN
ncbi:MAG: DUF692 domain-containing protein [Acidobacteria bacterium]|nr:DUF692 domain-containing protein [Acidobacteriota bacterium]